MGRAKKEASGGYTGPLAEPPMYLAALAKAMGWDPERPPLWFARRCVELDLSRRECSESWRSFLKGEEERASAQFHRNVDLLFQHYKIDRTSPVAWVQLAMALAAKHVPGLQIERAVQMAFKRQANKATKLDAYGTACFFLSAYLDGCRNRRPLTALEERFAKESADELKKRNLKPRTRRKLREQMLAAHSAYWNGTASDFQRQFVEEVEDRLFDILEHLDADLVARNI
jgi:hypothetical protein